MNGYITKLYIGSYHYWEERFAVYVHQRWTQSLKLNRQMDGPAADLQHDCLTLFCRSRLMKRKIRLVWKAYLLIVLYNTMLRIQGLRRRCIANSNHVTFVLLSFISEQIVGIVSSRDSAFKSVPSYEVNLSLKRAVCL